MMRIVLENIFFFMLPTLIYLVWTAFSQNEWVGLPSVIREAPLLRLFAAGAALMITTLVVFSTRSDYGPHDIYVPPSVEGGKLEPGHGVHEPAEPAKP